MLSYRAVWREKNVQVLLYLKEPLNELSLVLVYSNHQYMN